MDARRRHRSSRGTLAPRQPIRSTDSRACSPDARLEIGRMRIHARDLLWRGVMGALYCWVVV